MRLKDLINNNSSGNKVLTTSEGVIIPKISKKITSENVKVKNEKYIEKYI